MCLHPHFRQSSDTAFALRAHDAWQSNRYQVGEMAGRAEQQAGRLYYSISEPFQTNFLSFCWGNLSEDRLEIG